MDNVKTEIDTDLNEVVTREWFDQKHKLMYDAPRAEHIAADQQYLVLGARCHPGAPTVAAYDKEGGHLLLGCAVCEQVAFTIQVARQEELH